MNKHGKTRRLKWPLIVALVAGGAGLGWYLNRPSGNPLQYETTVVTRGELTQLVTASGQLTPLVKVEVGSQISGIEKKADETNCRTSRRCRTTGT